MLGSRRYLKKEVIQTYEIISQYLYYLVFQKFLRKLCTIAFKTLKWKRNTSQKTVWISSNALKTMAHHQIKILFETANCEQGKINQSFKANRLSLNVDKINYTLFHKSYIKDKILFNASIENRKKQLRKHHP